MRRTKEGENMDYYWLMPLSCSIATIFLAVALIKLKKGEKAWLFQGLGAFFAVVAAVIGIYAMQRF
ncbi:MAG: hypothetical protein Q4A15_00290 [Prevotellaceae bacterium]|nr:hypothetical protein [Prevotellaceae bacterium]